jgi:UDP:flavonoid glycosyltransferase YjiC (YdhE family)
MTVHEQAKAPRRRVLFVAEAVTLAHVGRMIALAQSLDPVSHVVCVASDPRYAAVVGVQPFPVRAISTISSERFFGALARGSPIYDAQTLASYVEGDLELLHDFRPDIVVGDFRLSLDVSARLAGVQYVNVTNAYWSPYAHLHYPVPDIPLSRYLGPTIGQAIFDVVRPAAFALHARPMNAVRRRFGLPVAKLDLRDAYTRADQTLYADLPELVPCAGLPPSHSFIGPVPWEPKVAPPDWWDRAPQEVPTIYVTLGSSGPRGLLPVVLDALKDLKVAVIAATAGRGGVETPPANALIADYLPGRAASARSGLVICNGGSPTSYQALSAGKPVIGVASNLDQYLNMAQIEAFGAGTLLRAGRLTRETVRDAVTRILSDEHFSVQAGSLAQAIGRYPACELFARALTRIDGPIK